MPAYIPLSKIVRPLVLAEIRALAGWPAYRDRIGLTSRNLSSAETRAAAEALGYDLAEAVARFETLPAPVASAVAHVAEAEVEAVAHVAEAEVEAEAAQAPAPAPTGSNPFEGRDAAEVLAEVLAPATIHMSNHLLAILPGYLAPLAEAAVEGPRTVTVTRPSAPVGAQGAAWFDVRPASRLPVWQAFGLRKGSQGSPWRKALERPCNICNYSQAPRHDPDYVWDPAILAKLSALDAQGLNAWIYGPRGTGKTESTEQYASHLKRPHYRVALHKNAEPVDLLGQMMPGPNGGVWQDGALLRAMRIPYAVILIDEPTTLRPGTLAALQTILDTRRVHVQATGENVEAAQGVFVIAADNTAGAGDDTGRYLETAPMNAAFMDRFALKIAYDYLPVKQEAAMLSRRSGLPVTATTIMVEFASLTRAKATAGDLTLPVGTRELISWSKSVKAGLPSAEVFVDAIINGAVAEDREILLGLASTSLTTGHTTIDMIADGQAPAPAPVAQALAPVSAYAKDFDNSQSL